MGTIATILIVVYLIVVLIIMLEKKIESMPLSQPKDSGNGAPDWLKAGIEANKWINFANDLSDSPSSGIADRPIRKRRSI